MKALTISRKAEKFNKRHVATSRYQSPKPRTLHRILVSGTRNLYSLLNCKPESYTNTKSDSFIVLHNQILNIWKLTRPCPTVVQQKNLPEFFFFQFHFKPPFPQIFQMLEIS
jgi:hypothetical protein